MPPQVFAWWVHAHLGNGTFFNNFCRLAFCHCWLAITLLCCTIIIQVSQIGTGVWFSKHLSIWTPSSVLGCQSLSHFLDCWMELAHETTTAFFVILCIMHAVILSPRSTSSIVGTFYYPTGLPLDCCFPSLSPFCILHVPCFLCSLPFHRLEPAPPSSRLEG